MAFERRYARLSTSGRADAVLTSTVEATARVVASCAACHAHATIYLAILGRWIELHRRKYPAHMAYTVNAHV